MEIKYQNPISPPTYIQCPRQTVNHTVTASEIWDGN